MAYPVSGRESARGCQDLCPGRRVVRPGYTPKVEVHEERVARLLARHTDEPGYKAKPHTPWAHGRFAPTALRRRGASHTP